MGSLAHEPVIHTTVASGQTRRVCIEQPCFDQKGSKWERSSMRGVASPAVHSDTDFDTWNDSYNRHSCDKSRKNKVYSVRTTPLSLAVFPLVTTPPPAVFPLVTPHQHHHQ